MSKKALSLVMLGLFLGCCSAQADFQLPYNGGSTPDFLNNNPFYMNQYLNLVPNDPASAAKCAQVPGVGLPILAVKKFLITLDEQLDATNLNSFVKIIFFKEIKTQTGMTVKLVAVIKTFQDTYYVGVEGALRARGLPRFQLISYAVDTVLNNVGLVVGEANLDVNNFIGCGDLKKVYTEYISRAVKPQYLKYNIPYGQTATPFVPPADNNQPPTFGAAYAPFNANPYLVNIAGNQ